MEEYIKTLTNHLNDISVFLKDPISKKLIDGYLFQLKFDLSSQDMQKILIPLRVDLSLQEEQKGLFLKQLEFWNQDEKSFQTGLEHLRAFNETVTKLWLKLKVTR